MIYWSIQTLILSIVLILLVHHLIVFFKDTLTIPKIKDLVNTTENKYENIYKIISKTNEMTNEENNSSSTTLLSLLPNGKPETTTNDNIDIQSMKNELRNFLKKNIESQPSEHFLQSSSSSAYSSY